MGQTSENVEANRTGGSIAGAPSTCLRSSTSNNWFLADCDASAKSIKTEAEIKQESETTSDLDTLYGTYDETTNSITIVYPGEESDGCMAIQECVQEVVSSESGGVGYVTDDAAHLAVPSSGILGRSTEFSPAYTNSMSPATSDVDSCVSTATQLDCASLSDGGYESHDSPQSHMSDALSFETFWSENFSEFQLFPTLG